MKAATSVLALGIAAGLFSTTFASPAQAAGLYYAPRGVRPLARGGAFVAGADDLGSIAYNPAGLADAGTSLLVDFGVMLFNSEYTRRTLVTNDAGATGEYTYPTAHGGTAFLPIPTIGFSYAFDKKRTFTIATGIFAPYTPLTSYAATVDGLPSGARYSLLSMDGTLMAQTGLWLAYKPIEQIRIGAGFSVLAGNFDTSVNFNANPRNDVLGASEDPQFDTLAQLKVGPIVSPNGSAGVTIVPNKYFRFAVAGELPFVVDSKAKIQLRLPDSELFQNASQQGDNAKVRFRLPPTLRIGVEARPTDAFRVEFSYIREFWSVHNSIDIDPTIRLTGITGFPSPFAVQPISIPRHFVDADSFRFGGEYATVVDDFTLHLRGGVAFERSAVPAPYVTALTIDTNKVTMGLGAGFDLDAHWRIDVTYAHVFADTVNVSPQEAAVSRVNPVRGNPTAEIGANGGTYSSRADVCGVGARYAF